MMELFWVIEGVTWAAIGFMVGHWSFHRWTAPWLLRREHERKRRAAAKARAKAEAEDTWRRAWKDYYRGGRR